MLDYMKIEELTLLYRDASPSLLLDCADKGFTPETEVHTIRAGNLYINTHDVNAPGIRDADFIYRFSEICNRRKPALVYDFSLCICKTSGRNSGMGFLGLSISKYTETFHS